MERKYTPKHNFLVTMIGNYNLKLGTDFEIVSYPVGGGENGGFKVAKGTANHLMLADDVAINWFTDEETGVATQLELENPRCALGEMYKPILDSLHIWNIMNRFRAEQKRIEMFGE